MPQKTADASSYRTLPKIENGGGGLVGTAADYLRFAQMLADDASGISGRVLDFRNDPIEGAIIYAYINGSMTGIPSFTSYETDKEGRFLITMDKGGEYYLKVRDPYSGGPPFTGNAVGDFGENDPVAITVTTGKITEGMDVKLMRRVERGSDTRRIK